MEASDHEESQRLAREVTSHGWYAVTQLRQEYELDDVHDGETDYRTEEYSVHSFPIRMEMDEYLEGQGTSTSDGATFYATDHRVLDYGTGTSLLRRA